MTNQILSPDFTQVLVTATGAVDVSVTVPKKAPVLTTVADADPTSYWFLVISGTPCFINYNAPATAANAIWPADGPPTAIRIAPGTVVHFLATSGTGYASLIRGRVI